MTPAPYTQHFFVQGKYLGAALRGKVFVHADLQAPCSYLFYCPCCGDAWARCPVEHNATQAISTFQAWARVCPKHRQSSIDVPGSLWMNWEADFTAAFPEEVVRWEFQRHMALYQETAGT